MPRRSEHTIMAEAGPIAAFVRQRRKRLGYTQDELAGRIGVGLRFLRELEQGKKSLMMDKVIQVVEYLGAHLEPVVPKTWAVEEDQP